MKNTNTSRPTDDRNTRRADESTPAYRARVRRETADDAAHDAPSDREERGFAARRRFVRGA